MKKKYETLRRKKYQKLQNKRHEMPGANVCISIEAQQSKCVPNMMAVQRETESANRAPMIW